MNIPVYVKSIKRHATLIDVHFIPMEAIGFQGQQVVQGMQLTPMGVLILGEEFAVGPLSDLKVLVDGVSLLTLEQDVGDSGDA